MNLDEEQIDWLIEHMVESSKSNPRMARGLRDLIKNAIDRLKPGSDEHAHLIETLNILDNYIGEEGKGYAQEAVARKKIQGGQP